MRRYGLAILAVLLAACAPATTFVPTCSPTTAAARAPHCDEQTDRLSTLSLGHHAHVTPAAVAAVAGLGRVIWGTGTLSGAARVLDPGYPLSATVAALQPARGCPSSAVTNAIGVYSLSLPGGGCAVTGPPARPRPYPTILTDIPILGDTTAARDAVLEPWSRGYLPRVTHGVRDAAHLAGPLVSQL